MNGVSWFCTVLELQHRTCRLIHNHRAGYADSDIGVLDSIGNYAKVCEEFICTEGVVSLGLMDDVVTHVAICDGANTKVHTKQDLIQAALGVQDDN